MMFLLIFPGHKYIIYVCCSVLQQALYPLFVEIWLEVFLLQTPSYYIGIITYVCLWSKDVLIIH